MYNSFPVFLKKFIVFINIKQAWKSCEPEKLLDVKTDLSTPGLREI